MTRINICTSPQNLIDEHLLAEHREIKRICYNYSLRKIRNKFDDIPKDFTLGTGHVLFFINKPHYTLNRYKEIHNECLKRGFKVQDFSSNWNIYEKSIFWNNRIEEKVEYQKMLIERISDNIDTSNSICHYYGQKISKTDAKKLLNK